MTFSPKVYVPVAIAITASVALKLLTGDDTYLVGILVGLVAGGGGVVAPPAFGVKQSQVARLAERVNRR